MDMDSKLRLIYIAKLLYEFTDEDHFLSTSDIIKKLESEYGISSHRQTVKRDIEVLQSAGCDIKERKSTQNLYHVVSREFDTAELRLLIDAVSSAKFITRKKSRELISKISLQTSRPQAELLLSCCGEDSPAKADNEKIYIIIDRINDAISAGRKISFKYFNYNVNKEKVLRNDGKAYTVSPLHLVWNGDHYYLIALKADGSRRNFRVDRIAGEPLILSSAASPAPEDFNLNEYLSSTIRMYDGKKRKVKLLCDNSVVNSIIDRFGLDTAITPLDENTFTAEVEVAVSNVFYGRIFGYGGLIKILEPEDVKTEFQKMLQNFI